MVCRFIEVINGTAMGTALERNGTATSATTAICPTPTAAEYGSLDLDAYGMATMVLSLATDGMHFILNQSPHHPNLDLRGFSLGDGGGGFGMVFCGVV